jgi:hypothetical protein
MPVDASRRCNPVAASCNRTFHTTQGTKGKRVHNADITSHVRLSVHSSFSAPIYNTQTSYLNDPCMHLPPAPRFAAQPNATPMPP